MKKQFLSIMIIVAISINCFACTSQVVSANSTNNSTTVATDNAEKADPKLTEAIKKLIQKDVIKSLMGDKTIHEIFKEAIDNGQVKEIEEYLKKTFKDINISSENFTTDESTYEWLSNAITIILKDILTNKVIKEEDIEQLNQGIGFLGIDKINIDFSKDNYTKEDAEKVALEFATILDKVLNPFILKLAGIDLSDPKFIEDLLKQIPSTTN